MTIIKKINLLRKCLNLIVQKSKKLILIIRIYSISCRINNNKNNNYNKYSNNNIKCNNFSIKFNNNNNNKDF